VAYVLSDTFFTTWRQTSCYLRTHRFFPLTGRLDLSTVLTKLHIFRLTQYSKIIFLDADVLPVRPMSHLFSIEHEFSAVPDVGWPDIFNSGVLVISPGKDKFDELMQLQKTKGSWDGGDQGLLNEWRGSDWNRLSFVYNTTPTAAYTYVFAYTFASSIHNITRTATPLHTNDLAQALPLFILLEQKSRGKACYIVLLASEAPR
jgi:lipopolysaccharide biosynthesis glycosyltransferase